MKVSCVLITRENKYPELVFDRLISTNFFDEFLVTINCPSVYQRYVSAEKAKNDIIYVQDDDCFVNYQVLFKHYNELLTNTMTKPFQEFYEKLECTLVGWGCFFPKKMLDSLDKYVLVYGKDQHLLREADRIFTYLNRPFNTIIMPHEDLPQNEKKMSIEPEHFPSAYEALRKVKALNFTDPNC